MKRTVCPSTEKKKNNNNSKNNNNRPFTYPKEDRQQIC